MQGLNVTEKGITYLWECLSLYTGACAYMLLYVAALIYICIYGSRREKEIFVPCSVFLLVTVYNPAAPLILDHIFDVNSEYYRFFWVTPVLILIPYLAALLITRSQTGRQRIIVTGLLVLTVMFSGRFVYTDGFRLAHNIYKMPDEMIEVSELIHKDSGNEYAKAFLEYEYNMQMRQYDPKMLLTIDREDYLNAVSMPYTEEMLNDEAHPEYRLLALLVRNQPVEKDEFIQALENTKTEYVVVKSSHPKINYLKSAGLKTVGKTDSNTIFKYELSEPYEFELVDYSVVY